MAPLVVTLYLAQARHPTAAEMERLKEFERREGLAHHTVDFVVELPVSAMVRDLIVGDSPEVEEALWAKVRRGSQLLTHYNHVIGQCVATIKRRGYAAVHSRYGHVLHGYSKEIWGRGRWRC